MHELFSATLKRYVRGWDRYQPDSNQTAAPLTLAVVRPRTSSVDAPVGRCGFSNKAAALGSVTNEFSGARRRNTCIAY